jgi:hypothetical protein
VSTKRIVFAIMCIIALLLLIGACGKQDVTTEPEPIEPLEPEEPIEEPEEIVYPYTAPLTGLGSMTELDHRIMAVMISNQAQARPQSGLDQADIVYEILAEAWITRLVAFYHSEEPEVIGPVRSLRPYLIDLALGFDAVFAHAGGSDEALAIVANRGLASLDEIHTAGFAFYRVNFRQMPHNLYTNIELLRSGAERRNFRTESDIPTLRFKAEDEPMQGDDANEIHIQYGSSYTVGYHYDPETELYTRYVQGEPHIDMETEEALTMTNVFVIETTHRILDGDGRRAIDVTGEGKGYLFQRGKVQEVDWKRIDGVIRPIQDGEEVGLYPGKTWVNVIPNQPGLAESVQWE